MHTVFALLCFVVVIHWLIFPYPSGLNHWHCGNLTIAPVPAKQPWWIWINTSCEFIMNDCITTTKQSTTKPCAYFLGYTVVSSIWLQVMYGLIQISYMETTDFRNTQSLKLKLLNYYSLPLEQNPIWATSRNFPIILLPCVVYIMWQTNDEEVKYWHIAKYAYSCIRILTVLCYTGVS